MLIETNTALTISLHPVSKKQEILVHDALHIAYAWKNKGLRVFVSSYPHEWIKLYKGEGVRIAPYFDQDPDASWRNCSTNKYCSTLHQGKLWKCPPLAYLPLIADTLETKALWEPYLQYKPLEIDASAEELQKFADGDSFCCDMCRASGSEKCSIVPAAGEDMVMPDDVYGSLEKNYIRLLNVEQDCENLTKMYRELRREHDELKDAHEKLKANADETKKRLSGEVEQLKLEDSAMKNSVSWKVTAPVRKLGALIRK